MQTEELCRFLSGISWAELPEMWREDTRYRLLDWIGCAFAGTREKQAMAVYALAEDGGRAECTVIGAAAAVPAPLAARLNAMLGHAVEFDDVCKIAIGHAGAVTVPAALAAAEQTGASFGRLLDGIAAGYEAFVRIGGALNPSHYEYWHTTGTCGTFAAAAAAARVVGLSGEAMQRTFGLAGTCAAGLIRSFGTDAKLLTVGNAAANGVYAVRLAGLGFSAPGDILEGPGGYPAATSRGDNAAFLTEGLGETPMIAQTGYKIHASCGHTHTAVDAFFDLRRQYGFRWQEIDTIEARVYPTAYSLVSGKDPSDAVKARFSLPYCLAAAAVYGVLGLEEFADEAKRCNERIRELMARISIRNAPEFGTEYPLLRRQEVTVTLKNGTVYRRLRELPEQLPAHELLENKFVALVSGDGDPTAARRFIETFRTLRPEDDTAVLSEQLRELNAAFPYRS